MKHFYQNIHGWFTFPNLYSQVASHYPDGSHFVEIGVWKGKSASYMAVELINNKKQIKFDCIDTWEGSAEHLEESSEAFEPNLVLDKDWIWKCFNNNIAPVKNIINPIRKHSLEAVKLYQDNSVDFVFIDASHDFDNVTNDLKAWYPKVKLKTGIMAGHDYSWGPEVKRAVNIFFETKNIAIREQEGCWIVYNK